MTEKGMQYKLSLFREKRQGINARLLRKSSSIEELLHSNTNIEVVHAELAQLHDMFKQLFSTHDKYWSLTEPEDQQSEEHCFEELDSEVFTFKHKVDVLISR